MTLAKASPIPWLYPLFPSQLLSALPTPKEPLVQKAELACPPPPAWPAVGFHRLGLHPIPPGPVALRERLYQKPQNFCKNLPFLFFIMYPPILPGGSHELYLSLPPSSVLSLRNGGLCQASANRLPRDMWVSARQMVMGPDTSLEREVFMSDLCHPTTSHGAGNGRRTRKRMLVFSCLLAPVPLLSHAFPE